MRNIFPNVVAISDAGLEELVDDQIRELFEELIAERSERTHETHTVDVRRPGGDA
jgi:hypothetical protein